MKVVVRGNSILYVGKAIGYVWFGYGYGKLNPTLDGLNFNAEQRIQFIEWFIERMTMIS